MLIDALAPEKDDPNIFHPVTFKASSVDYIREVNDTVSALVLKSGLTIPVACPFQELKQMVYEPDLAAGPSLDLTPVTGPAVKDVMVARLADEVKISDEFNQNSSLMISALLRKTSTNQVINCTFSEDAVSSYEPKETPRAKSGLTITIHFNTAVRDPFGTGEANLDMPYDEFITFLTDAKKKGSKTLDLCSLFAANPKRYGLNPQ